MSQNAKLLADLQRVLTDSVTMEKVTFDFQSMFTAWGMFADSESLASVIMRSILYAHSMEQAEEWLDRHFKAKLTRSEQTVYDKIEAGQKARFELLYSQVQPHLYDVSLVLDYRCGSGVLTQMLGDRFCHQISGVDVRDFRGPGVTVPILQFDGYHVPVEDKYYTATLLTNVLHHDPDNERILQELDRITSHRLVIVETVSEGKSEAEVKADRGRMLLNDVLWYRLLNKANTPCSGAYDTPQGWIQRFEKYGWGLHKSRNLGFDHLTNKNCHHLLVFER